MGHMPYGYRVENGTTVICEKEAGQIRDIYAGYLSGLGYVEAARNAGLSMAHTSVKRMLQNRHYLGDDFYPAIIDRGTFDAAEEEHLRRSAALGRDNLPKKETGHRRIQTRFKMGRCEKKLDDPYEQATYIYSLIESEE